MPKISSQHYAFLPVLLGVAGCGAGEVPRYDLSGTATYDGQPVPAGYMIFASNGDAGNQGPGAQVDILDGKYETLPGQGTIGGPHIVTILAFDGQPYQLNDTSDGPPMLNPMGKPLFDSVSINVDLPKQNAAHDFVIPRQ